MQVVVDSILANYLRSGAGKTVLLLHGWGDNSTTFTALQKQLSESYDVIVPDLPGFGQSEMPKDDWGLDEYADFVKDFLAKVDAKPFAIIGHSNGGAIALRSVGKGTLNTDKLVLLASSGNRQGEMRVRNKGLRVLAKGAKLLTAPLPKQMKRRVKIKAYQKIGSDLFVAEHLQGSFKKIIQDDIKADAANISTPTLLIYGSEDTATPPGFGQKLASIIPNATLKIIEGVGHFVHQDSPDIVGECILEFLK